jgi:thiol-disulfide isomerase/thioredoxin
MSEKAADDRHHQNAPQAGDFRTGRLVPRLVLAALLLLLVVVGAVRLVAGRVDPAASGGLTVADQLAVDSQVRHRVVEFHGLLLADGRPWSSLEARGQVLVVNFWASWCGPCRAEQPGLSQVAHAYRDRGVRFIGVNIQDTKAAARSYVEEFHVRYPSLFDPPALTATRLQAVALPTTFILDRDGMVAFQLTGKTTPPILAARLDALLGHGGRWSG